MNIIFDNQNIEQISKSNILLELDTFYVPSNQKTLTAYCLIETVPVTDFSALAEYIQLHQALLENYKKKNWQFCEDAIDQLTGKWNGEMDSFYQEFSNRIENFKSQQLPEDWSPILIRNG
jgi:hypothetical protein